MTMSGSISTTAKDILAIYQKYLLIDHGLLKYNLHTILSPHYRKGGKKEFAKRLGFENKFSVFCTLINKKHKAKVTFENLILITGQLNLDIDQILTNAISKNNMEVSNENE
jgi:hypothetical protein